MKRAKQIVIILCFVLGIGALSWWVAAGTNIYTKTSRMVEVKDDLFGTTTQKWEKDFIPGLDWVGPIAGVLFIVGGVMLYRSRKRA